MACPAGSGWRIRPADRVSLVGVLVGLSVGLSVGLLVGPAAAQAPGQAANPTLPQSVTLAGSMGADKALLVVDGQALTLAVGASARGITLRRLAVKSWAGTSPP